MFSNARETYVWPRRSVPALGRHRSDTLLQMTVPSGSKTAEVCCCHGVLLSSGRHYTVLCEVLEGRVKDAYGTCKTSVSIAGLARTAKHMYWEANTAAPASLSPLTW